MVIIEASKPKTKEGRIFSETVNKYAEEFVEGPFYIEQQFFGDSASLMCSFNNRLLNFGDRALQNPSYFPEKVTTWVDGKTTIQVNEGFVSHYKSLEALEGIAKHALSHVGNQLRNNTLIPSEYSVSSDTLDQLFPTGSLTTNEKFDLWKACYRMEDETETIDKTIEKDPYSTIAEAYETTMIVFDATSRILRESIRRGVQTEDIKNISRKDFVLFLDKFHMEKDASFLTSSNKSVLSYEDWWTKKRRKMESQLFSSFSSDFPQEAKTMEDYRVKMEKIMGEYYSLLRRLKPKRLEDFAGVFTELFKEQS